MNPIQKLLLGCFLLLLGVIMFTVPGGGAVIGAIIILCALSILVLGLADWPLSIRTRRRMARDFEEELRVVSTRPRFTPTRKPRGSREAEELQAVEPSDLICQHCDFVNPKGHRYCGSCGYPLSPEGTRVY